MVESNRGGQPMDMAEHVRQPDQDVTRERRVLLAKLKEGNRTVTDEESALLIALLEEVVPNEPVPLVSPEVEVTPMISDSVPKEETPPATEAKETLNVRETFVKELEKIIPEFEVASKKLSFLRPDIAAVLKVRQIKKYVHEIHDQIESLDTDQAMRDYVILPGLQSGWGPLHVILNNKLMADAYFSQTPEFQELYPIITTMAKLFLRSAKDLGVDFPVGFDEREKMYLSDKEGTEKLYLTDDSSKGEFGTMRSSFMPHPDLKNVPEVNLRAKELMKRKDSGHSSLISFDSLPFSARGRLVGGNKVVLSPGAFMDDPFTPAVPPAEHLKFSENDNVPLEFKNQLGKALARLQTEKDTLKQARPDLYGVLKIDNIEKTLTGLLSKKGDTDEEFRSTFGDELTSERANPYSRYDETMNNKLHEVLRAYKLLLGYFSDVKECGELINIFTDLNDIIRQAAGYAGFFIDDVNIGENSRHGVRSSFRIDPGLKSVKEVRQTSYKIFDIGEFPMGGRGFSSTGLSANSSGDIYLFP